MNRHSSRVRITAPRWLVMTVLCLAAFATPALCFAALITLANTQGLAFGSFVAGTGGSLTVNTSGGRSSTGGIALLNMNPTAKAATFNVTGDASVQYTITLPGNGAVSLTGPGTAMAVNGFTSSPASSGTLSGGAGTIAVGATLTVGNSQTPGSYSGSFDVTVTYQ